MPWRSEGGDERPEFGDRHLAVALGGAAAREHRLRVQAHHELPEPGHAVVLRRAGPAGVLGAVLQHEFDGPARPVEHHVPAVREVDNRVVRIRRVGQEDVPPDAAARRHVADKEHAVRKVAEEHPGLDLALDQLGDDVVFDLAGGLVRVGHGPDVDVEGEGRGHDAEGEDGPDDPVNPDAAGLEGDPFAVAREAAEADENPDQQGHRNGHRQRLRHQREHQGEDGRRRSPFGDQRFPEFQDERQGQHEREDQERHQERRDDCPDDVAVEDSEHTLVPTRYHTRGGGRRWAAPGSANSSSTGGVMERLASCLIIYVMLTYGLRNRGASRPGGSPSGLTGRLAHVAGPRFALRDRARTSPRGAPTKWAPASLPSAVPE